MLHAQGSYYFVLSESFMFCTERLSQSAGRRHQTARGSDIDEDERDKLGRRAQGSRVECVEDLDMIHTSDTDGDQPTVDEDDEDIEVDVEECSDSEQHEHRLGASKLLKPAAASESGSEQGDERDGESPDPADDKAGAAAKVKIRCNCEELLQTECHLETKELWDKFHDLGTEMIITKTGR